jgi:hypothetical protein
VAEVPQEPPEPRRPTRTAVVVRDDEDSGAEAGTRRRGRKRLGRRQRVAPLPRDGQIGELVDSEKRRPWDVLPEVSLVPGLDPVERVAAVDEPVLDQ